MKRKYFSMIGFLVMVVALTLPQVGNAVTITSVDVDVVLDAAHGGAKNYSIWDAQIGAGTVLNPGQQLILTQNGAGTNNYNFDTSEDGADRATPATRHTVTVNGFSFVDPTGVLMALPRGEDPETTAFNEALDWVLIGTVAGQFQVFVGYADNAHTDPCQDADGNCFPNPLAGVWPNSQPANPAQAGITFFGNAVAGGCIRPGVSPCYDAGALRIVALNTVTTPEPGTMMLLGLGLAGLAVASHRRKLQK